MRPINHLDTAISTTKEAATSPPAVVQPRSPWHSPVPYLFGGLAAMLGLVAFALLILACSYWRISSRLDSENEGNDQRDLESGNEKEGKPENKVFEEKFLVIMAGNEKPTFLATPVCSKVSSFVDKIDSQEEEKTESTTTGHDGKVKSQEMIDDSHDQTTTTTTTSEENTETQENHQQVQEQN